MWRLQICGVIQLRDTALCLCRGRRRSAGRRPRQRGADSAGDFGGADRRQGHQMGVQCQLRARVPVTLLVRLGISSYCLLQPRKLAMHDGLGSIHGAASVPCRCRQCVGLGRAENDRRKVPYSLLLHALRNHQNKRRQDTQSSLPCPG